MIVRWPALIVALWWGSLTTVGALVVPMLFAYLPTSTAGTMAARLFAAQTWVSLACGIVLLLLSRPRGSVVQYPWAQAVLVWVMAGMLLALVAQFGIAPRIVARQDLRLWHSIGTLMYLLQWVCALRVLWLIPASAQQPTLPAE